MLLSASLILGAPAADRVDSLPGWSGPLPSPMYSGFLALPGTQKQLHYLLVEAEPPLDKATAPLVLWPHHIAPGPAPGPPGPAPGKKARCRVVGTSTKVTPVPSHDHQYDSYIPSRVGTYEKQPGTYCATVPAHVWVYTGNVDKATCQSK